MKIISLRDKRERDLEYNGYSAIQESELPRLNANVYTIYHGMAVIYSCSPIRLSKNGWKASSLSSTTKV